MSGAKENACNPRRDKTSVTNTPNTINMLLTLFTYIAIFTCDGGRRLSAGHPSTCIFPVSPSFEDFLCIGRFSSHYNLELMTTTRLHPTGTGGLVPNTTKEAQAPSELFSGRFWHAV